MAVKFCSCDNCIVVILKDSVSVRANTEIFMD